MSTDILIVGSGPAGLTLAAACALRGLRTEVWSPTIDAPWHPTWGAWTDTVPAELRGALGARWPTVDVHTGNGTVRTLDRGYARFDTTAFRAHLFDAAICAGVVLRQTAARATTDTPLGSQVVDGDGITHEVGVVVDATGTGALLRRKGGASLWQTAFGMSAEVDGWPGPARWMDFTPLADDVGSPTFLYGFPTPDGRVFLEETSLVRSPPVPVDVLERRLRLRLAAMGVRVRSVAATETCVIPMDLPLPDRSRRVVGFGASASMVHPATGYLLPRVWRAAPLVADALASGLGTSPAKASRAAWDALWPKELVRTRALHLFGARAVSRLDGPHARAFFDGFFDLPPAVRDGWLDDRLGVDELARGMVSLFRRLSGRVRWRLLTGHNPFRNSEAA